MRDELLRIMNLVKVGKLSPEEGVELAESMGIFSQPKQTAQNKRRMLYIQVREKDGDKVDIKIPVGLTQLLKLSLPALKEKLPNVDLEFLSDQLDEAMKELSEIQGDIINATGSDGTTVRIFID
ncbi:SHOCT-like domain-containing protein [Pseudothermotoga sp. U03pept]|uniref:SHOCT-like domain-containing protein n=1 Tax=Pseudothermotoga sp. U03pept TaxID=3447012 RepID=UPI003EFC6B38